MSSAVLLRYYVDISCLYFFFRDRKRLYVGNEYVQHAIRITQTQEHVYQKWVFSVPAVINQRVALDAIAPVRGCRALRPAATRSSPQA